MSALRTLRARGGAVAFLTYHRVGDVGSTADDLNIPADIFEEQVAHLSRDYELITANEVFGTLHRGARLPRRGVVLTFDDGYADMATTIAPILNTYEAPATFFISSGLVYPEGGQSRSDSLTIEQLVGLSENALFEIGGHTKDHIRLSQHSVHEQYDQIAGDKRILEGMIGRTVDSFSYPYGTRDAFTAATVRVVKKAGYSGACTTELGVRAPWGALYGGSDRFQTPRIATNRIGSEELFNNIDKALAL